MSLALLLLSILPLPDGVLRETCDVAEVNHFYNDEGSLVFTQLIFREYVHGEDQIIAWRMLKSADNAPHRDWQRGGYVSMLEDNGTLREVRSAGIRETWLQYDVEVEARKVFPAEVRRGLRK